jgi:hypothetical protein
VDGSWNAAAQAEAQGQQKQGFGGV